MLALIEAVRDSEDVTEALVVEEAVGVTEALTLSDLVDVLDLEGLLEDVRLLLGEADTDAVTATLALMLLLIDGLIEEDTEGVKEAELVPEAVGEVLDVYSLVPDLAAVLDADAEALLVLLTLGDVLPLKETLPLMLLVAEREALADKEEEPDSVEV